jgi:hypothetical protein
MLTMKIGNYLVILLATISLLLLPQSEQPRLLARVPNAKYLFAGSAAPSDPIVFFGAAPIETAGEYNTGTPTIIRLAKSGIPIITTLAAGNIFNVDMIPAWNRDGKTLYFETQMGVFSYRTADDSVEKVWKGSARGLAISRDGKYLSFWIFSQDDRNQLKLVLFDLRDKSEKQTWVMANVYGGDEVGFEIAFAADNKSIYARTYDHIDSSPLQRFAIGSVSPEIVSRNITSVVAGENAVYFVTEKLENDKLSHSLMALPESVGNPEQLKGDLPCRSLAASGSLRWIVCKDDLSGKAILLFDSERKTFAAFEPARDNVVVMSDGGVVYSLKGSLFRSNLPR